jgi:hypothetical protein
MSNQNERDAGQSRRRFIQMTGGAAIGTLLGPQPLLLPAVAGPAEPFLDKQKQLERWSFWDNRDWDWYKTNIPFFESPDQNIDEIYYYRWEVVTKHLRYASPEAGYIFTEFLNPEPLYWAGRYNSICGAAELHLKEARWLKTPQFAQDYCRYWFRVPGAQPRNYMFAAAEAAWSVAMVHGDARMPVELLDDYIANYQGWEKGWLQYPHDNGWDPNHKLFWNTGRDSSGEYNLASAQLSERLRGIEGYKIRGGAGYRPDINAAMYAEALAISRIADLAGRMEVAAKYRSKARRLKKNVQDHLWDPRRDFFVHRWRYDEYSEGDDESGGPGKPVARSIKAWSRIWETNLDRFGGVGHQPQLRGEGRGREHIGYVPWLYNLPDDNDETDPHTGYARAWRFLMDPAYFFAPYGPTTAERNDPWFSVIYKECRWNGDSWPFNTCKILDAAANLLNNYQNHASFSRRDYFQLLRIYALSHYKAGVPYLAESHNPFNQDWTVDRWYGRHYFHSMYANLIITGLAGLRPREDHVLEVNPLIPDAWDYMALDDVTYWGRSVTILWDRTGQRYGRGAGLSLFVDGKLLYSAPEIRRIRVQMPAAALRPMPERVVNWAVNADRQPLPKASASFTGTGDAPEHAIDGLYWFHQNLPIRWTSRGSKQPSDWFEVDFGRSRPVRAVRLYLYEDDAGVRAPIKMEVQYWQAEGWVPVRGVRSTPETPEARRANRIEFNPIETARIRVVFTNQPGSGSGLAEFEALNG